MTTEINITNTWTGIKNKHFKRDWNVSPNTCQIWSGFFHAAIFLIIMLSIIRFSQWVILMIFFDFQFVSMVVLVTAISFVMGIQAAFSSKQNKRENVLVQLRKFYILRVMIRPICIRVIIRCILCIMCANVKLT